MDGSGNVLSASVHIHTAPDRPIYCTAVNAVRRLSDIGCRPEIILLPKAAPAENEAFVRKNYNCEA